MSKKIASLLPVLLLLSCGIRGEINDAYILKSGDTISIGDEVHVQIRRSLLEQIIYHRLISFISVIDCRSGTELMNLPIRFNGVVSGDFKDMKIELDRSPSLNITVIGVFETVLRSGDVHYCVRLKGDGYSFYRLNTEVVPAETRIRVPVP